MGHWTLAASRLYYAAYYASSALLVSAGYTAKTHEGTIGMIGQNYIRAGILEKGRWGSSILHQIRHSYC